MRKIKLISFLFLLFALASTSCSSTPVYLDTFSIYQEYDDSFSSNYKVRKVSALKGKKDFLNAMDVSFLSAIEKSGQKFYDEKGYEKDFFSVLKADDVNGIRLRLFYDHTSPYGKEKNGDLDLDNVLAVAKRATKQKMKIILDFHYSDSWADPAHQQAPYAFKDMNFEEAKGALYTYTKNVMQAFEKEKVPLAYVQIGNEIDNGFCYPFGQIDWSTEKSKKQGLDQVGELLKSTSRAVREISPSTQIIIHTAMGLKSYNATPSNALWFYHEIEERGVDYDIIGSSYYPFNSDTKISSLTSLINQITDAFQKPFMLMEYSYGFTIKNGDETPNFLHTTHQIPEYPLSIQGQTNVIIDILEQVAKAKNALGACYWGGEWIPCQGIADNNWENQALFTYEGIALPSLSAYKKARSK